MATARPARSRRVNPDVEEEEEPPTTTRSTRRAPRDEEPEEEKKPARRSRAAQNEEADTEPDEGEEETAVPFHRGRKAIADARTPANTIFFTFPKDSDEAQVVKFLDEEPWGYQQHWVTRAGKQSFPCLGKGCPLCAVGAKVSQKVVYAIVNLSLEEGAAVQAWEVTGTIDDDLASIDAGKTGPLTKGFFALSRSKLAKPRGFQKYNYSIIQIKERDLEEDWDITLDEADDAVADAKGLEPSKVLGKVSRATLQEIADEIMD